MNITLLNNLYLNSITSITELYRNKADGILIHAGLELQLQNGTNIIFHSLPGKGPHLTDMKDFIDDNDLIHKKVHTKNLQLMRTRIEKIISEKKSYTLLYNCEHLVTHVVSGVKHSPQLKSATVGAAVGAGIGYALTKNKLQGAILGGLCIGFLSLQYINYKSLRCKSQIES